MAQPVCLAIITPNLIVCIYMHKATPLTTVEPCSTDVPEKRLFTML